MLHGFKTLLRQFLSLLPTDVVFFLTLIAFWPTAYLNLFYSWLFPKRHRRWDRITDHVILGAVPLWRDDVRHLREVEGVTGIVNCCREWDSHLEFYGRLGMRQLHVPTLDFFLPSLEDCRRGVAFIHDRATRGESVYVHCKAGKGRSTTIVLCYLVYHKGMRLVPRKPAVNLLYAPYFLL